MRLAPTAKSPRWLLVFALAAPLAAGCTERKAPEGASAAASSGATSPQGLPAPQGDVAVTDATRDAVASLLGGREYIATKAQLDQAGPPAEVAEALRAMAKDGGRRMQHRVQALSLLRFYPEPRTYQVYEDVFADKGGDPVLARTSVKVVGEAFGARAVPLLEKALAVADAPTREGAVTSLAALGAPEARAALERHAPLERDPLVAAAARRALGR